MHAFLWRRHECGFDLKLTMYCIFLLPEMHWWGSRTERHSQTEYLLLMASDCTSFCPSPGWVYFDPPIQTCRVVFFFFPSLSPCLHTYKGISERQMSSVMCFDSLSIKYTMSPVHVDIVLGDVNLTRTYSIFWSKICDHSDIGYHVFC